MTLASLMDQAWHAWRVGWLDAVVGPEASLADATCSQLPGAAGQLF